jgi:hypothetical protein
MKGGYTLRPLRPEDYDALVALWRDAGLSFRPRGRDTRAHLTREIRGPCSLFLGAERHGRLVAAVLGTHDGRKGWINRLAVHPQHRGRGLARALVAAVEQRLRARGIHIVACLIEEGNDRSVELFQRLGYREHPEIRYLTKRETDQT